MQEGEIGVILTPDAACLAIETSPGWMEAFIQAVKQHEVLIGDHGHDLVYDLREEEDEARFRALYLAGGIRAGEERAPPARRCHRAESLRGRLTSSSGENWFLVTRLEGKDPDAPIYSLSSGAIGQDVDMFGLGRWKELLDILAPYGISEEGGWCPVPPERKRLALPHAAARGRDGRANRCRDEAASGFPAQRRARESDPAREREGAGQAKTETRRKKPMREPSYFTHEEYAVDESGA